MIRCLESPQNCVRPDREVAQARSDRGKYGVPHRRADHDGRWLAKGQSAPRCWGRNSTYISSTSPIRRWRIGVKIGVVHAACRKFRAFVQRQAGTPQRSAFDFRSMASRQSNSLAI